MKDFFGLSMLIELNSSSSIEQELLSELSEQFDDNSDGEYEEEAEEQQVSCDEMGDETVDVEGSNEEDEDGTSVVEDKDVDDAGIGA